MTNLAFNKTDTQLFERIQRKLLQEYRLLTKPNRIKIEGIKINIGEHVSPAVRRAMYMGKYENPELRAVKFQLSPNDIVMEVGTGIGLLSSYCAKRIGSEKIFTYEANPELEAPIRETYRLNNVSPHLEMCLIGEQNGEETFYVGHNFWSASTVAWDQAAKPITVRVKSFNQEVRKINPTFLILDIEGGEYELLNYADFHNVKKLVIEIHPKAIGKEKTKFVKNKLAEIGFQVNEKYSSYVGDTEELFLELL